jgi:hypothetical protein
VDDGLRLASGTGKKPASNVGADRYNSTRDAEMKRIQLGLEVPYWNQVKAKDSVASQKLLGGIVEVVVYTGNGDSE